MTSLVNTISTGISEFTAGRENGRRRPRGYAEWRPQAKTQELLEQVQEVFSTYEDFLPLTVRQVFYALVGNFEYPKTDNAYERLCEHLVRGPGFPVRVRGIGPEVRDGR